MATFGPESIVFNRFHEGIQHSGSILAPFGAPKGRPRIFLIAQPIPAYLGKNQMVIGKIHTKNPGGFPGMIFTNQTLQTHTFHMVL